MRPSVGVDVCGLHRLALAATLAFASTAYAADPAPPVAGPPAVVLPSAGPHAPVPAGVRRALTLESGTGRVLVLEADAANVFVADPKVAEVRPASASSLFVFGVGPGRTTVAAMDAAGHMLAQFDLTVRQSGFAASEAEGAIARLMPESHINVVPQAKGMLLTGSVASPAEAARAVSITKGFLTEGGTVENQIAVGSQMQVTLRVRIAEVSRQVVRNLGINWAALGTIGSIGTFPALNLSRSGVTAAGVCLLGDRVTAGTPNSANCRGGTFDAVIDALAQDGLVRVLAEPNLTVMSGEQASFLAGGEFPIPIAQQNNQVTVEFKKYGVSLAFVPTVLADGRINMHVNPEVSQLSTAGAVQISVGNSSLSIPALTVRRAETTVELGSGQSFAIAGLMMNTSTQADTGLPIAGDVPVLGALFRSDAFQRNESELVIVITPIIVRPVNEASALTLPTDGAVPAGDFDRILLLRQLTRQSPELPSRIPGQGGFIVQ